MVRELVKYMCWGYVDAVIPTVRFPVLYPVSGG